MNWVSETVARQVEAALDSDGMTPAQVHERVGRWSRITIKNALRELHKAGRIMFKGKVCRRKYMRAA